MQPAPLPEIELGLPGWRLRAWQAGVAASLAAHANDPDVWRWDRWVFARYRARAADRLAG